MGDGYAWNGRTEYIMDGIIDMNDVSNYCNFEVRGRTGDPKDGDLPWNIFIDLGDYYELSRIVTHQRRFNGGANPLSKGVLYGSYNVGIFNMYIWDDETDKWELIRQVKIPMPENMTEMEIIKQALAGDVSFMFPDDPGFTKPTRWFRYEALYTFRNNYTETSQVAGFSELTIYGKKANK
jgi:hypothetical protein